MAFGLGRGLEALIPNKAVKPVRPDPVPANGMLEVELACIVPNPHQPRKQFKLPELEELAASIKEHGVLEPLVVSPARQSGQYILIAGERRLRASEMAGLAKVPVVVRQTDDQEKLELALIENIQRQDLNPLEEAKALRKLMREFGLSHSEIATRIGRSRPAVGNCLRLLELTSEVQQALLNEQISEGHAKVLGGITGPDQIALMREIIARHLSVRQTEQRVREILLQKNPRKVARALTKDAQAERDARSLTRYLGAKVLIDGVTSGKISIQFHTREERDRIVNKITGAAETQEESVDADSTDADVRVSRSEFTV